MANFRLGQRVKFIGEGAHVTGLEGVITALNGHSLEYAAINGYGQIHWVYFPACPTGQPERPACAPHWNHIPADSWGCWEIHLVPLTDPHAEAFAAFMRNILKPRAEIMEAA